MIRHTLATVDRQAFLDALHARCDEQRAYGTQTSVLLQLESGFDAFEDYFYASTWLTYGTASMGETLAGTASALAVTCYVRVYRFPDSVSTTRAECRGPTWGCIARAGSQTEPNRRSLMGCCNCGSCCR